MTDTPQLNADIAAIDPHHMRETLMLLSRAIRDGWQIPEAAMRAAPNVVAHILATGNARERIRAAEVLVRMRDSNINALATGDKIERLEGGSPTEIFTIHPIVL